MCACPSWNLVIPLCLLTGWVALDLVYGASESSDGKTRLPDGNYTLTNSRPLCTSRVSPESGSVVTELDTIALVCKCQSDTGDDKVQICPAWTFLSGRKYVGYEEEVIDSTSGLYCSHSYKFRLSSGLHVGRKSLELVCNFNGERATSRPYVVYLNTPEADPVESPNARARLGIYMILAIIAFLLLTFALFGWFFRWQIKSRRRARREAVFRNPFLESQPHFQVPFTPTVNPGFQPDNPPSYNDATSPQNAANILPPSFTVNSSPVKDDSEKIKFETKQEDQKNTDQEELKQSKSNHETKSDAVHP